MKTKKRFLSILLSLALVLGLMPGMGLTAYAEDAPTLWNSNLSGTGWAWDANTKTLTLSGVNWSGTLVMPADSKLVLTSGTRNTITGSRTTAVYYGSSKIGDIYTGYTERVLYRFQVGESYTYIPVVI